MVDSLDCHIDNDVFGLMLGRSMKINTPKRQGFAAGTVVALCNGDVMQSIFLLGGFMWVRINQRGMI